MKYRYFFFLIPLAFLIGLPWLIMTFWNHLMPVLFSLKTITYWQAAGLFILGRLLFGNFGFRGRQGKPFGKKRPPEGWMQLSEEEKATFRAEWKRRGSCA